MNYWSQKEKLAAKAKQHTEQMEDTYDVEIRMCVHNSQIYSGKIVGMPTQKYLSTTLLIEDADSVSSIIRHSGKKTCVLNFASYKHPGGMFMNGSSAQEESLCHESFLYNVLSRMDKYYEKNQTNLNRSLYTNRAIYTPDVCFERDGSKYMSDVLTCAAPNKTAAQKYCSVSDDENLATLEDRIDFLLMAASLNAPEVLILGAFGCGVFGQNAEEVASIFKRLLTTKYDKVFNMVVFPIPDASSTNFRVFRDVFTKH